MSDMPMKPRKKRLKGEAYWKLVDLQEEGEKLVKAYGEWARKECRRLKLLPDVVDFVQGVVWDEPANPRDPSQPRKQVALIEDEAVITEAIRRQDEVNEINMKIAKIVRQVAMAAGVRPEQVNVKAGEIILDNEDPDIEDFEVQLTNE